MVRGPIPDEKLTLLTVWGTNEHPKEDAPVAEHKQIYSVLAHSEPSTLILASLLMVELSMSATQLTLAIELEIK